MNQRKHAFRALSVGLALIVVINVVDRRGPKTDPLERIADATAAGNFATAESEYKRLRDQDFSTVAYHRGYIRSHLNLPARVGRYGRRDDRSVLNEYQAFADSASTERHDIGCYGLGYFHSIENDYALAESDFNRVTNSALPYLNASLGFIYRETNRLEMAEAAYRRELSVAGGSRDGAFAGLADILSREGKYRELDVLVASPEARNAIPDAARRRIDLRTGHFIGYLRELVMPRQPTVLGIISAVLVLAVWFRYLRLVDVFEREPISWAVLAVAGGALCSVLATPLYDLWESFGFRLTGAYLNDALFCILGIGFIEETVKILPVILILRFTPVINESVDYIIYPSLSALGFAFMESFWTTWPSAALEAFWDAILHMALTSLVVYGVFYSKYRRPQPIIFVTVLPFAFACLAHGVYSFWLVERGWVAELSIVSAAIFLEATSRYGKALNAALNVSEHVPQRLRVVDLTKHLCDGFAAVVVVQYATLAYRYGTANANQNLVWVIVASCFIVFVLMSNLARFNIERGKWIPVFEKAAP